MHDAHDGPCHVARHAGTPALELGHERGWKLWGQLGPGGHLGHRPDYTTRAGLRTSGRIRLDEPEHPAPGVVARVFPLGEAAVEEAVRGAVVDVHLVGHPGAGEIGRASCRERV